MEAVIVALLAFCAVREFVFLRTVDKLTNKIMSRDYQEMRMVEAQAKQMEQPRPSKPVDMGEAEDLGSLQGIGVPF